VRKIVNFQIIVLPSRANYKNKTYSVPGPPEVYKEFNNLKEAKKYAVSIEKRLNIEAAQLNKSYIEVFAITRRLWFYFSAADLRAIDLYLSQFNFSFGRLYYNGSNFNYFVFTHLAKCKKALGACLLLCSKEAERRGNYVLIYEIKAAGLFIGGFDSAAFPLNIQ